MQFLFVLYWKLDQIDLFTRMEGGSTRGSSEIRARMAREGRMPSARRWASLPSGALGIQNQDRRWGNIEYLLDMIVLCSSFLFSQLTQDTRALGDAH